MENSRETSSNRELFDISRLDRAKSEIRQKNDAITWAAAAVDVRKRIASQELDWSWVTRMMLGGSSSRGEIQEVTDYPLSKDNLCYACQGITVGDLLVDECLHHENGTKLIESAMGDECRLCLLILESFKRPGRDVMSVLLEHDEPIWLSMVDKRISARYKEKILVNDDQVHFISARELQAFTQYNDRRWSRGKSQLIEFIGQTMKICLLQHSECRKSLDVLLPSRLIDLGCRYDGTKTLRLWTQNEGIPETGIYTALSYRWGKSDHLTLTPETYKDLQTEISWVNLPKTVQDAIEITRGLGIRYIWVDALCIMQGLSREAKMDWTQQSVQMDRIYGRAAVVLGAASMSADEGMEYNPYQFKDFVDAPSHWTDTEYFGSGKVLVGYESPNYEEELGVLHSRGWAFQERLLASRFIHIGREKVFFECDRKRLYSYNHGDREDLFQHQLCQRIPPSPSFEYWYTVVEEYSKRSLTVPSDNLIGLAGIAKRFSLQAKGAGDYLAGLWRGNLACDLLWHLLNPTSKLDSAPSWSWASRKSEASYHRIRRHKCGATCVQIVDTDITGTTDPFGHIVQAKITVKGYLRKIFISGGQGRFHITGFQASGHKSTDLNSSLGTHLGNESMEDRQHRVGKCFMDSHNSEQYMHSSASKFKSRGLEGWNDIYEVWCLQLHASRGILLKSVGEHANEFERIGYYEYDDRRSTTDKRCFEERSSDQSPISHAVYFVDHPFKWMSAAIQACDEELIGDWFGDPDAIVTFV